MLNGPDFNIKPANIVFRKLNFYSWLASLIAKFTLSFLRKEKYGKIFFF
jgi:hypothetical protein